MKEKYVNPQLHVFHLDADLLLASGPVTDECTTGQGFSFYDSDYDGICDEVACPVDNC